MWNNLRNVTRSASYNRKKYILCELILHCRKKQDTCSDVYLEIGRIKVKEYSEED